MPIDKQITFLERCVGIVDKYGLIKIGKAVVVILVLTFIAFGVPYVPKMIETVVNNALKKEKLETNDKHNALIEDRKNIKPIIIELLNNTLNELNADRVFVMEFHNGNNNTSGLPFLYAEMTYEVVADNITHIDEDYLNINLSRFTFPEILEEEGIWIGSIDSLSIVDNKLALRMKSNDAKYMAIGNMYGLENELGYLGITWVDGEPPAKEEIIIKAVEVVQKISTLIDTKSKYYTKSKEEV